MNERTSNGHTETAPPLFYTGGTRNSQKQLYELLSHKHSHNHPVLLHSPVLGSSASHRANLPGTSLYL
jgi:hypothetical protein